jgi:hypothetical protein
VQHARRHGLSRTAIALKLGYYTLKERMEQSGSTRERWPAAAVRPTFVELPSVQAMPALGAPRACVVEFEKAGGSRMRIALPGADIPDLVALARGFCESP